MWEREKETERFMTDELAFIKYIRTLNISMNFYLK